MKSTKAYYPSSPSSPDLPSLEDDVLSYWKESSIFERSVAARPAHQAGGTNEYVFYDGPPFANGLPHHGHLLTGFVKDLFARYHTMKGQRTERRFGWDCHGLPAEMAAEKELNISGRKNITDFGIGNFNDHCRKSVMQFRDQWEWYVNRQARWVDFENDYKTMDTPFMESTIWAFSELYKKGYIYEGFKVMPYSWAAETVLSTSEIRLDDATREKEDKAVTVAFKLKDKPEGAPDADNYYVLAWTTTPWTLPSNLALAVSGQMDYSSVVIPAKAGIQSSDCYILASAGLNSYAQNLNILGEDGKLDSRFRGNDIRGDALLGLTYEPLFPYFAATPNAFRILDGSDFIEEGSGTGIVHMAPGFGEDDQRVCAAAGIETIVPVNGEGRYTDAIYDLPATHIRHPEAGEAREGSSSADKDSSPLARNDAYIETRRCILRRPLAEDGAHFIGLHTNAKVMETMNDGPLSVDEAKEDFVKNAAHFDERGYGQWAVFNKETGEFMGRAGLTFMAQSAEMPQAPTLRCCLHEAFWHGGYGSELCHAALWYGFSHKGLDSIVAGAHPDNPRAISMMTRLGMHIEKEVQFKRKVGPYLRIHKETFDALNPPLSLRGLNVIKETKLVDANDPFKPEQIEKFGLANLRIIKWLKSTGRLIKEDQIKHNYPHCWRTDQPIIYMAMSSWFVDVPQFRDRMVELNQQINWIPGHIKDGRFGKWLENAREWSISRSRFWGCPIPVWRSDNPDNNELYVFGSIKELEEFFGPHISSSCGQPQAGAQDQGDSAQSLRDSQNDKFKIIDLHRPFIDTLTAPDPKNPAYTIRRVEDVFDCWFESGSMPYAQVHYPFENKEWFESHFPADFIVEYEAQTRGWFYSMMVLSVALFDRIPFKNCICHGVVLDESGRKLSKKLQNYLDPKLLFDQYGSDALRWFMMASPIMRGSELLLDAKGQFIHDAIRLYIKPIWNAYHFFTLYANADGVKAKHLLRHPEGELNLMDRYILAKCRVMVEQAGAALDAYDTPSACSAITDFVEVLNNWYIRRNKDRFWSAERQNADKQAAYDTLFTVLDVLCRTAAPLLPMVSEAIYLGLHQCHPEAGVGREGSRSAGKDSSPLAQNDAIISVHLAEWPDAGLFRDPKAQIESKFLAAAEQGFMPGAKLEFSDEQIMYSMDRVRDICNVALSIRSENKIRVRQPLGNLTYYGEIGQVTTSFFGEIIKDEINVHRIEFGSQGLNEVAEQKLTIFFPVAGKRLGGKMKAVGAAAKAGDWKIEGGQMIVGGEALEPDEYTMQLVPKAGVQGAQALASNDALVVLDLTITPELKAEGTARDVVRLIQQARKEADLHVADRIDLHLEAGDEVTAAVKANREYVCEQTLCSRLEFGAKSGAQHSHNAQIEGEQVALYFSVSQKAAA